MLTEEKTLQEQESEFKELLSTCLKHADERTIFSGTEVKDMLLDLWLALNRDINQEN